MSTQLGTLEERIAVAVNPYNRIGPTDVAALIEEVDTTIADAVKTGPIDAVLATDRLGPLREQLQARISELYEQEEAGAWRAQQEAKWFAECEELKRERDALAEEARVVCPTATQHADLFARMAANDKALSKLHRKRPDGINVHLASAEQRARELDGLNKNTPSVLTSVLFEWRTGYQIWPPPEPTMAAAYAETMMPVSGRRFSGDWWQDGQEAIERQRAEQQRIAEHYARMTKEQEDREKAEARERFMASQRKISS